MKELLLNRKYLDISSLRSAMFFLSEGSVSIEDYELYNLTRQDFTDNSVQIKKPLMVGRKIIVSDKIYNLTDESFRFIYEIYLRIFENITLYYSRGYIEFPLMERIDTVVEYIQELYLLNLSFNIETRFKKYQYYLRISKKNHDPKTGWYIYRYFEGDELVYIGRTNKPVKRYFDHCKENSIYTNVTMVEIYQCETKADMIFLERLLITKYLPPWNIVDTENGQLNYEIPQITYSRYTLLDFISKF